MALANSTISCDYSHFQLLTLNKLKIESLKFKKMKNLVKISFALAIALFVSMSVNAQSADDADATGTITVDVVRYLEFDSAFETDVAFTYDEFGATKYSDPVVTNVMVKGNIDWTVGLFIFPQCYAFVHTSDGTKSFGLEKVSVSGFDGGNGPLSTNSPAYTTGSKTGNFPVTFTLSDLGNEYAGTYEAEILYTLFEGTTIMSSFQ